LRPFNSLNGEIEEEEEEEEENAQPAGYSDLEEMM